MTRREKILLQICIAIGLIGLGSMYLLRPSIAEKKEAETALELAEIEELQIKTVLDAPGVEEKLEEQKALAKQNYEYFYGKLNSYTIDGIINQLVSDCEMEIEAMSIGQYTKIDVATLKREEEAEPVKDEDVTTLQSVVSSTTGEDTDEPGLDAESRTEEVMEEKEDFLLGCQVILNVNGSYDNFLKLLSVLKAESTCIEISAINLQTNDRSVDTERSVVATVELLVYGIDDTMVEGKDK